MCPAGKHPGGGRWGQRGGVVITLFPFVQGNDDAVGAPDGGTPLPSETRDPPARRRSPCGPNPARRQHRPGQGARQSRRGSARRDESEMSMVKSLERLEQRLAVMVAAQETSQAWSSLGEEGPVCFLFLFFQPSLAECAGAPCCRTPGVATKGLRRGARRGWEGSKGNGGENGGKCRSPGVRRESLSGERGQAQETGQGRGEAGLLMSISAKMGSLSYSTANPATLFFAGLEGNVRFWGQLKAICVRDSPEPSSGAGAGGS